MFEDVLHSLLEILDLSSVKLIAFLVQMPQAGSSTNWRVSNREDVDKDVQVGQRRKSGLFGFHVLLFLRI